MKKLLVPIDFSEESEYALDFAAQLVRKSSGEIFLLHIVESQMSTAYSLGGTIVSQGDEEDLYMALLAKDATIKLNAFAGKYPDLPISPFIKIGNLSRSIADIILEKEVDLIVLSGHNPSEDSQEHKAKNIDAVVHHAKCPVITVKKNASLSEITDILYPTSLTKEHPGVLVEALKFQRLFDAKLHILRVNHGSHDLSKRDLLEKTKVWEEKYYIDNYEAHLAYDKDVERGIERFAEEYKVGMIVIGVHHKSGLTKLFSRKHDIAEDVAVHAPMAVCTL